MTQKARMFKEVQLRSGVSHRQCWVDDSPMLKPGNLITLRDSENPLRWWEIMWVGSHLSDKKHLDRTWQNNI